MHQNGISIFLLLIQILQSIHIPREHVLLRHHRCDHHGHINFTIAEDGTYAIVTEHVPSESNMQIFDENQVELLPIIEHEVEGHSH